MNTNLVHSIETYKVMKMAQRNHWGFRVNEGKGMIEVPEYRKEWWYIPVKEDEKIIPENARTRVEAIKRLGIPIQGLIIGHEAPKLLSKPSDYSEIRQNTQKPNIGFSWLSWLLMLPLVLIDPALYIVLPDGTWVEVMTWLEPF